MTGKVTYARLDKVLRSLGFAAKITDDNARAYRHETGALIVLAYLPDDAAVLPRHLIAARTQVDGFGIADAAAFDEMLAGTNSRRPA